MSTAKRIAWIGTGVMGGPMAGHLMEAGHDVVVNTRTPGPTWVTIETACPGERSNWAFKIGFTCLAGVTMYIR